MKTNLDKVYATALKLFKVGEPLPASEIAKRLKMPIGTVADQIKTLVVRKLIKKDKFGKIILVK